VKNTQRTYEIRADNSDPAKAGEWAVYAVGGNEHARRIAHTTNKAEAEAVLIGLLAAPDLLEACKAAQEGTGDWRAMLDWAIARATR